MKYFAAGFPVSRGAAAVRWLASADLCALEPGTYPIDGENVYATVADNRLERETPAMQTVSAARIGAETAASAAPLLRAAGLRLETELEDCPLTASPALLQTALYNLLDNARKASPPGESVRLTGRRTETGYRFDVAD